MASFDLDTSHRVASRYLKVAPQAGLRGRLRRGPQPRSSRRSSFSGPPRWPSPKSLATPFGPRRGLSAKFQCVTRRNPFGASTFSTFAAVSPTPTRRIRRIRGARSRALSNARAASVDSFDEPDPGPSVPPGLALSCCCCWEEEGEEDDDDDWRATASKWVVELRGLARAGRSASLNLPPCSSSLHAAPRSKTRTPTTPTAGGVAVWGKSSFLSSAVVPGAEFVVVVVVIKGERGLPFLSSKAWATYRSTQARALTPSWSQAPR
mmetsp:Transcript_13622/g.44406  ORF Transcript_13622/g.44406 Transcript_13622/m.44406 type:complete len:264 (-) Transcript_13622:639-1430(-)